MRNRRALDSLAGDIRDHLERETADNIERGMSPAEARAAALRKFGNVPRVMEETRAVWHGLWLDQLLQDLRYGLRYLRRNPRFAAVVVLTMALGIGVNTAVFSVVNTVLLKPLDYPDAARLVWIGAYDPNLRRDFVNKDDFFEWRRQARSFSSIAAFGYQPAVLTTPAGPHQATAVYVAGDFWRITGARPAIGELFREDTRDSIVLTWDFFQREFAGDRRVVGRTVDLNARHARIAGVLPRGFRFQFPMWWAADHPEPVEAYLTDPRPGEGIAGTTQVVAALRPGATVAQAGQEMQALERHLIAERGGHPRGMADLQVVPLQAELTAGSRGALLLLSGAGIFVLLIAVVNVANLLLARSTLRRREVAIRAAMGAGRSRAIRQWLAESVLQSLAGGVAGLLLAYWAIQALIRISPNAVPRLSETAIDGRVLAFTFGVSVLAGILFGAAPALTLRRANLHDALKNGARSSAGPIGLRLRRLLVAAELSLSIVLLTGAGLMLKSFALMTAHAPGFDPAKVIVMNVRFHGPPYIVPESAHENPAQRAYLHELLRRTYTVPGVQSAGVSCWILVDGFLPFPADPTPGPTHVFRLNAVSPGYFQALGMTLREGRWLADGESHAALLNETMARLAFGSADPVGRQISLPRPVTIAGVVADGRYSRLDAAPPPEVFIPLEDAIDLYGFAIAARTRTRAAALVPVLEKQIAAIDPSQPVFDAGTLEAALAQSIAPRRFNLFLLAVFAAAALLLAVVGIYGVASYSVAERTREIGVRMALGARRGQVASMVIREIIPIAAAAIAAGLAATWPLARFLGTLLYGVSPQDPATLVAVALFLAAVTVLACLVPAIKAATIDPTAALHYD